MAREPVSAHSEPRSAGRHPTPQKTISKIAALKQVSRPKRRPRASDAHRGPHYRDPTLWEVDQVVGGIRSVRGVQWVLVHWTGYGIEDNTWEKLSVMKKAMDAVKTFWRIYGKPNIDRQKILSPEGELHEKLKYGPEDDYIYEYLVQPAEPVTSSSHYETMAN
ncbi:hypothetical protein BV898_01942 [Hypsibius exemplaris]|uniref:Chromo domain-containing protein n=1 Tax=Hypsibius exemplaris TaxID=2072580 RepID=A0A1W0XAI2_HYPEX|nr:hypothetical protein BV898_01942 [Hypsibius exemplaris]